MTASYMQHSSGIIDSQDSVQHEHRYAPGATYTRPASTTLSTQLPSTEVCSRGEMTTLPQNLHKKTVVWYESSKNSY